MNINKLYEYHYVMQYDAVGGWVIRLCKKPGWGRKFPPLEPPPRYMYKMYKSKLGIPQVLKQTMLVACEVMSLT